MAQVWDRRVISGLIIGGGVAHETLRKREALRCPLHSREGVGSERLDSRSTGHRESPRSQPDLQIYLVLRETIDPPPFLKGLSLHASSKKILALIFKLCTPDTTS